MYNLVADPAVLLVNEQKYGSSSLRVNTLSRRGEGGVEWSSGPLWSPAVPLKDGEPKILAMNRIEKYTIAITGI
jgi:hypothetical protein